MTDFSKVNIHCSSIGNIMSEGRGSNLQKWKIACDKLAYWENKYKLFDEKKREQAPGRAALAKIDIYTDKRNQAEELKNKGLLSKGAKSHLKKVYGYHKYGKWCAAADKGTKYTNKGTLAEQASIDLISRLQGMQYVKNEERANNEFLTGIPDIYIGTDIYHAEYVIDVKTSWDIETFLDNLGKPLCSQYWWQIQGYLAITGAKLGEVSYCLVNTPQSIINNECYRLKERLDVVTDIDPAYLEASNELINNLTFDDMPEKDRRLRFLVERDDEAISRIYNMVAECREYLAEIEKIHDQGVYLAKEPVEDEETEEILEETE